MSAESKKQNTIYATEVPDVDEDHPDIEDCKVNLMPGYRRDDSMAKKRRDEVRAMPQKRKNKTLSSASIISSASKLGKPGSKKRPRSESESKGEDNTIPEKPISRYVSTALLGPPVSLEQRDNPNSWFKRAKTQSALGEKVEEGSANDLTPTQ